MSCGFLFAFRSLRLTNSVPHVGHTSVLAVLLRLVVSSALVWLPSRPVVLVVFLRGSGETVQHDSPAGAAMPPAQARCAAPAAVSDEGVTGCEAAPYLFAGCSQRLSQSQRLPGPAWSSDSPIPHMRAGRRYKIRNARRWPLRARQACSGKRPGCVPPRPLAHFVSPAPRLAALTQTQRRSSRTG